MNVLKQAAEKVVNTLPLGAWQSYENPRLKNNESEFLDQQHIAELKYNSSIKTWEELEDEEYIEGIGTLRRIGFTTELGYAYSALVGIPEQPESDIPVIGTSAWFTSTEGHNEHSVRNLVRAGNYVFFVGAEGSYEPAEKPTPSGPITLADSAAAVLNFSYHANDMLLGEGHVLDERKRIVVGESRGGMVGMGIVALSEEYNQDIVLADLTAPCLPRKMKFRDLKKLSEQISNEPREIIKLIGNLTLARLIHYPSTIDLSPYSMLHQFVIGFALFSGEAGALAKHINQESLMHITVFKNDFASMSEEWREIFKDHPNVHITALPGSHLTLADLETLMYLIGRNKAAQFCNAMGIELTPSTVYVEGNKIALDQRPLPMAS